MEAAERPIRALEQWAAEHGQPQTLGELVLPHFGGPAWAAIRRFYRENTALARHEAAPFLGSCFFYDAAFWPLHVPVIYGQMTVDPIRFVKDMPPAVFRHLGYDSTARNRLDAHWFDCYGYLSGMSVVVDKGSLGNTLAENFLHGADAMLDSAVASLLTGKPNAKAAEHSRFAFESALKALVAKRENVTNDDEFRKKISHFLDRLLLRCQPYLDSTEHQRLTAASTHYPDVKARYANQPLTGQVLWTCYAEARHASTVVLRALGGPNSGL